MIEERYLFSFGTLLLLFCASADIQTLEPVLDHQTDFSHESMVEGNSLNFPFKHVKILDSQMLDQLKNSASVGAVYYYYMQEPSHLDFFFEEFDKSASFLEAYGISLGVVDCNSPDAAQHKLCESAANGNIIIYRHGVEILKLDLDTMFDVNSIMSNILQLALLKEVSIVQNLQLRQQMEHEHADQTDIIFAYHNAIGTYEHRIFMEIAFAYQDKYKFIISTELDALFGLPNYETVGQTTASAIWVLYCREQYNAIHGCHSVSYRGDYSFLALAKFVKALDKPRVHYLAQDGPNPPCEIEQIPCIFLEYSAIFKKEVDRVIKSIQHDVVGVAGLVLSEIKPDTSMKDEVIVPKISIKYPDGTVVSSTLAMWSLKSVEKFLENLFQPGKLDLEQRSDESVDKIDDSVLQVAYEHRKVPLDVSIVPALTDKTFPTTVKKSKLLFVLFHLPFDARSSVFLHIYQEAAKDILETRGEKSEERLLAGVNCFDWTDVCSKENITIYPTVMIYRNGGDRQEYTHALDKDFLIRCVMLLSLNQPLLLQKAKEVSDFIGGKMIPAALNHILDNLVILRLSQRSEAGLIKTFNTVVRLLETQMLFALVSVDVEVPQLNEDTGLLLIHPGDKYQMMVPYTGSIETKNILTFLLNHQFHLLPELTPLMFPTLYAKELPFGILFIDPNDTASKPIQDMVVSIIKAGIFPNLIFCQMTFGEDSFAANILPEYADDVVLPTFAVVRHRQGEVFVLQDENFTIQRLTQWIRTVLSGEIQPTKRLEKGEWKPHGKYYDFLTKIDRERKCKEQQDSVIPPNCDGPEGSEVPGEIHNSRLRRLEKEERDSDIRSTLIDLQKSRLYSKKDHSQTFLPATEAETNEKVAMATMTSVANDQSEMMTSEANDLSEMMTSEANEQSESQTMMHTEL